MPFTFVAEPRVWWPVKVRVPADGGATVTQEFEARFRIVPASLFSALMQTGAANLLSEVIEGWRGVVDEQGEALPIARLPQVLELPFILSALSDAYADAMLAGARKN